MVVRAPARRRDLRGRASTAVISRPPHSHRHRLRAWRARRHHHAARWAEVDRAHGPAGGDREPPQRRRHRRRDRKSTRLNSSHVEISYAVFCLKKKKKKNINNYYKKKKKKKITENINNKTT